MTLKVWPYIIIQTSNRFKNNQKSRWIGAILFIPTLIILFTCLPITIKFCSFCERCWHRSLCSCHRCAISMAACQRVLPLVWRRLVLCCAISQFYKTKNIIWNIKSMRKKRRCVEQPMRRTTTLKNRKDWIPSKCGFRGGWEEISRMDQSII